MPIEFPCPHCGTMLKVADGREGAKGKCKACGEVVTVPGAPLPELELEHPGEQPLPAKAAPATAPPADKTMPRSGYAPSAPRPPLIVPPRRVSITQVLSDLGGAFRRQFLMLLASSWITGFLSSLCFLLAPMMTVGYTTVCLESVRGEDVEFGDLFEGFVSWIIPSYVVAVVYALVFAAVAWVVALPFGGAAAAGTGASASLSVGAEWGLRIAMIALTPFYWLGFPAVADGAEPHEALRFAVLGGLHNWPSLVLLSVLVTATIYVIGLLAALVAGAGHIVIALGALVLISPGVFVSMCSAYEQVYAREAAE